MVPRRPPRPVDGLPRRVECARLTRCQIASRRADPVQVETLTPQQVRCLAWIHNRAHPYTLIYLIIIKRLSCPVQCPAWRWCLVSVEVRRLTVCPPAWRKWCIGSLCIRCIACAGIGQINGNAPVKPCKRFWRLGGIIA